MATNPFGDLGDDKNDENSPPPKRRRSGGIARTNRKLAWLVGAGVLLLLVITGILVRREWIVRDAKKDGDRIREIDREITAIDREFAEMNPPELPPEFDKKRPDAPITPRPIRRNEESEKRRSILLKEALEIFKRNPGWADDKSKWGTP